MSCRTCFHGKARHGKASSPLRCYCCIVGVYDYGAKKKTEEPKLADADKIVVEVTKQEAPPKEPSFSWWICWRDKREDKEFKCLTVDEVEQVSREVDRLGGEFPGRQIWVSTMVGAYTSRIMVEPAPTNPARIYPKSRCVN